MKPSKIWIVWVVIAAVLVIMYVAHGAQQPTPTTWEAAKKILSIDSVQKVSVINREQALIYLTPEALAHNDTVPRRGAQFSFPIKDFQEFAVEFDQISSVPIDFLTQSNFMKDSLLGSLILWPVLILFVGVVICVYLYKINKNLKARNRS